jgi:hypothetical protein
MTFAQEAAASNLDAAAANFTTEIMRRVADPDARGNALRLVAQTLHAAVAGIERRDGGSYRQPNVVGRH